MEEMLDFGDLTPVVIPIKIGGKSYTLHEADGAAECAFKNAAMRAVKLGEGNRIEGISGDFAGADAVLVSACLRDEQGQPVPVATLKSWPRRILDGLVKKVKEISEMEDASLEGLKKQREALDRLIAKSEGREETLGNE